MSPKHYVGDRRWSPKYPDTETAADCWTFCYIWLSFMKYRPKKDLIRCAYILHFLNDRICENQPQNADVPNHTTTRFIHYYLSKNVGHSLAMQ